MKNIKFFILFFLFLFSIQSDAEELKSLKEKYDLIDVWEKDDSELAYVSMRCGVIYSTLAAYFLANGTKKEDKDNSIKLNKMSEVFMEKSIYISISMLKMSEESITKRMELLFKIYVEKVKENKSVNNNVFEGLILNDFEYCNKNRKYFVKK